ncbi:MAG: CHASE2 domain-containing protein, partial [Candidatus Gastranaerophilales bacterium]|nr:CHASE2 domain-containing protein [Candidatus Gastranaerophilales bacterium]
MKIVKNVKPLIIIFSILIFMLVAYIISTTFFEPKAYNFMVGNFAANKHGSNEIVIITIDDKSLAKIRWPWKRELYGKIFEYLNKYSQAKVVGFDAIIATPDIENPQSDLKFYSSIKNMDNLVVGFVPLGSPYEDGISGTSYDKAFKKKFAISVNDERIKKSSSYYESLSKFPSDYFNSVQKVGSVITTPDFDGYIRSIDQFIDYKGTLYPSLSLRIYDYLHPDNTFIVKDGSITASESKLKIPIYDRYNGVFNNIHYYRQLPDSEYSHKTYSAIDILDSLESLKKSEKPKISPQEFQDKIVFVGANAKAIAVGLEDVKRTPISDNYPGVDIQATNLDNIIHNEFLVQTTFWQDILSILLLLGLTFFIIRYFSLAVSLGLIALIMIIYIVL